MMNFWSALYRRKRSVRLQLLVMALVPLMVLLPVLLVMGISRWNNDYNNLLIAKVESELQVAEQYLQRIVGATGTSVEALAASLAMQKAAEDGRLDDFLTSERMPWVWIFCRSSNPPQLMSICKNGLSSNRP